MRKALLLSLLLILVSGMTGCSQIVQVEDLAYALVLGVDLTEDAQLRLTMQVPKITGSQGSESGSSSSDALHFSATGKNFIDALTMLEWAVPRRIDLSQLELIVLSESLAQSDAFSVVTDAMMNTARLYSASRIVICQGSASEFVKSISALIGSSTATDLPAMFANYIEKGFIPDVTFADVYYKMNSIYSDPLAVYASQADTAAAAMIVPKESQISSVSSNQSNAYLGAAIIHNGRMTGTLNSEQLQYCLLLRGHALPLSFHLGNRMILLKQSGNPKIRIDTETSPASIDLTFRFTILPDSEPGSLDGLEESLSDGILSTIQHCQSLSCEPFEFAEKAARQHLTYSNWLESNWMSDFCNAQIHIDISLKREDL